MRGGTAATTYYLERLTVEKGYIYGDSRAGIRTTNDVSEGGYVNVYINECMIRNNHTRKDAGNQGGHGGLFHFVGNRSLSGGGGWKGAPHSRGANLTIANSIFWDNGPKGLHSQYKNATISNSDIEGGLSGTGFTDGESNISGKPLGNDASDAFFAIKHSCIKGGDANVPMASYNLFNHGPVPIRCDRNVILHFE